MTGGGDRPVTGATRVAGVIGSPIRHSRSPQLINAAFAAMGLDWTYVAFEVAAGHGSAAVDAMRTLGLGGLSVTMPHKVEVLGALDRLSPDAQALGAVNCIAWDGDELVGHSTDGAGLVRSLTDQGWRPGASRCVVLGAGGAARAVIRALASAGVDEVVVVNRTASAAETAVELAGPVGRIGTADDVEGATLVVNATSVGMGAAAGADGPLPCDPSRLHAGQTVVDLVYQPLETPLLRAARRAGAQPVDGLGMLVHQAAVAVEHWTGRPPELSAMHAAARG